MTIFMTRLITLIFSALSFSLQANIVSLEKVTADVTYLASDKLKGRKNYSPEIDIAADYIAQRYTEIGLQPLPGEQNFKQKFNVTTITPNNIVVELNGDSFTSSKFAIASTLPKILWTNKSAVNTHVVTENDNLRNKLTEINELGGEHLVLINPVHKKTFLRYQHYFQQGLAKLTVEHTGALVLVLTEQTKVSSINIQANSTFTQQQLTNVVGVLAGNNKKDQYVLYSAHYDHLGAKNNGTIIYNGADDNASGTTAVINLAEYFAKEYNNKPKENARSLIFSAFAAEELGGFGSQYFASKIKPVNITAMINIEMIGKPSKFGLGTVWMTGMERSNLGELLNKALKPHQGEIFKDPYPEQRLFYRSDNATLARLGVPAHSFSSTQLDIDPHYHQPSDDITSLNLPSMHNVINTIAIATKNIVDGTETVSRINTNEVKTKGKIY